MVMFQSIIRKILNHNKIIDTMPLFKKKYAIMMKMRQNQPRQRLGREGVLAYIEYLSRPFVSVVFSIALKP